MFDLLDFSTLEAAGRIAWRASWQASALALAVFAVLACARHRISAAWRYGLWSLVLARLLLPWAPPAQWSPFNLAENRPQPAQPVVVARPDAARRDLSIAPMIAPPARLPVRTASAMPSNNQPARPDLQSVLSSLAPLAVFAWLLGVLTMLGGTTWQLARLRRAMKGWRDVDDRGVLELADECRARLGLRRRVRLRVAPDEMGPAVYGIIRPRVVLPESLLTEFSRGQLEAILLHEMAHVRRHDPAIHWLMIAARVLHWFNPIAWFALSRMAAERELACDDAVIEVLGRSSRQLYGETILRLVGRLVEGPAAPGLVHFFGSRRRLWRRLDSLARAKAMGRRARWVTLALLVGLAAFGLTDAVHTVAAGRDQTPPQPSPKADTAPAPKKEPMTWPLGDELAGKVVDDKGEPVADAEVVPLGPEKLTLYPVPGPGKAGLRLDWMVRDGAKPASTKTDNHGHFSIRRSGTPANRIGVISQKVLLWVASREQLGDEKELTIRLPKPGVLTIRCDIPGKPKKQEFWMSLRTFDGVDWNSDSMMYRDITSPNPGDQTVKNLPPAQYVVERLNLVSTDKGSNHMTLCERTLVAVESAKRADIAFERKAGRDVQGIVKGLDGVKLRQATLTVGYLGPEEVFLLADGQSRKSRQLTYFDSMPIGEDRRFSIPKLPPGDYYFDLFAVKAATPRSDIQNADFNASARVNIPEKGELPPVEVVAKANPQAPQSQKVAPNAPGLEVHAKDEAGAPVADFDAELYTPTSIYRDATGVDGVAVFGDSTLRDWGRGDLIVSAPGYASTIVPQGPVTKFRKVDVTLKKGKPIRLKLRDSAGKPLPPEAVPFALVYREKDREQVWQGYQMNDEARRNQFNRLDFLKARPVDGDLEFRVASDLSDYVYLAFSHPDILRFFGTGPLRASQIEAGIWDVTLPEPAMIDASLKAPAGPDGQSPFAAARYQLLWKQPNSNALTFLTYGSLKAPSWRDPILRLAPGAYEVYLQTDPREGGPRTDMKARPGIFADRRSIEVKPGKTASAAFEPPPFNPNAWRSKHSAVVKVAVPKGRNPSGDTYRVSYMLAHYGLLTVAEGNLAAGGTIALDGLAASGGSEYGGMYWVEVNGLRLGDFRIKDQPGRQEFTLRMPPQVGDLAPEALGFRTDGRPDRDAPIDALKRGDVVFLEFWATWCGPCQEPMHKLAEIGKRRGDEWAKKGVRIVAISIDDDRDALNQQIGRDKLNTVQHFWSPKEDGKRADTAKAVYSIDSVPTAFLIGRNGRILWRGHPQSIKLEARIDQMLAEEEKTGKR